MTQKRLLFSCEFYVRDESGADWIYETCILQAATLNGWEGHVLAPNDMKQLPDRWHAVLRRPAVKATTPWAKVRLALQIEHDIVKGFNKVMSSRPDMEAALLASSFTGMEFLGFVLAALRLRQRCQRVMAVFRFPIHEAKHQGWIYRMTHILLRWFYPVQSVCYFTDTQALAKSNGAYLHSSLRVLPIPHTTASSVPQLTNSVSICCWWAGLPRPEKGLAVMQALVRQPNNNRVQLCIIVAESAHLKSSNPNIEIQTVPNSLSRTQYETLLNQANIILLPYYAENYRERSSGIFVEAVTAGKAVLVPKNTWMAQELVRYGLEQFAIEWSDSTQLPDIIHEAVHLHRSQNCFLKMQTDYQAFHSVRRFADVLQQYWS